MLVQIEAYRISMKRQQLIRLAKLPCTRKVVEGGQKLKCHDIYRVVTVGEDGEIRSIKCLSHGHDSRGQQRQLENKLKLN